VGEVVAGRYELLVPLASGGMGTVWTVRDLADDQVRAAKILRQSDAASLLRFVREQSVRIDHAHVVTPLSWAGMDDRVLFTMPLVRGGSVADLLRDRDPDVRALPTGWVAALLDQVLGALGAVHATGVVHRDVKPGNLLLDPSPPGARPHLRLTDFGIAVPVDEPRMTRASVVVGTPGYMAPEQWQGADPDPRADLYAAGRVAQELFTGRRPRAEDGPASMGDLVGVPGADPARDALARVVLGLLAPDPALRPASADAARSDLRRRGLADLPVEPTLAVPDRLGHGVPAPLPTRPPAPADAEPTAGAVATATRRLGPGEAPTQAAATPAQPSPVPAVLLLLVGLLALLASAWLLLG